MSVHFIKYVLVKRKDFPTFLLARSQNPNGSRETNRKTARKDFEDALAMPS